MGPIGDGPTYILASDSAAGEAERPVANDHRVCTSRGYFRTVNRGAMFFRLSSVGLPLCAVFGIRATLS